ncbi:arylamine N-acetyltransferase 1 [Bimuria novae-zelandiae CBS 107.79]|uniref:Arylamine N-acetyltransferase 1 n=1 Tax=Bimuria novae-zelandiae CBS 107.79 TaxID=1447943 RepID=A0A6A5UXN6_9PLEO|nr:arylamine N-acetyltransferase 1 [Bimuria novae-zelandiae CBS 107.79]
MSAPTRPAYTPAQIAKYFDRLKLPEEQRNYDVTGLNPERALAYLQRLQRHHLAEIPFENLSLHYSPHRQICIHPEELFRKIIGDDNGRGGYCMENTGLFAVLLHSLGFDCYSAGARVFNDGRLSGWSHMIIIVKLGGQKYHVDVGFGANGPIVPMPLDRSGTTQSHISPAAVRLQWRNIPQNTDPDQRLWVYEHRIDENADFETKYCFTELEFLPGDYWVMNLSTSTSPTTFFTQMVFMEKKLLDDHGEIIGNIILGKDVKWRIHGGKEREVAFESEDDRVKAIEEHFGIKLSVVEQESILGLVSQIK